MRKICRDQVNVLQVWEYALGRPCNGDVGKHSCERCFALGCTARAHLEHAHAGCDGFEASPVSFGGDARYCLQLQSVCLPERHIATHVSVCLMSLSGTVHRRKDSKKLAGCLHDAPYMVLRRPQPRSAYEREIRVRLPSTTREYIVQKLKRREYTYAR